MSASAAAFHSNPPFPEDLRQALPHPGSPLQISDALFSRMEMLDGGYRKTQVLPSDPEWCFVWHFFYHSKPNNHDIKRIFCVHQRDLMETFCAALRHQELEAKKVAPNWQSESQAAQRGVVSNRWENAVKGFSPFQTGDTGRRKRSWNEVKILPMWQGATQQVCESIAAFGYTPLERHSAGDFGHGIYFTNSARYAADVYAGGHLLLGWVSVRPPFPVVDRDMTVLRGKGAYKHYNAHYVPVTQPANPHDTNFFPCKPGEAPIWDELVVFQNSQTLPRFWVELEPDLGHTATLSAGPTTVKDLIPHLYAVLKQDIIDQNSDLRLALSGHLERLLIMNENDALDLERKALLQQLGKLVDPTTGMIDQEVKQRIVDLGRSIFFDKEDGPLPPLHQAARRGDLDKLKQLIAQGADLNAVVGKNRWTPAFHACAAGRLECLQACIEAGVDKEADCYGQTLLHIAAIGGHAPIVEYLLSIGADKEKQTPAVKRKTQRTLPLHICFFEEFTPLHFAAKNGHTEAAKLLIQAGANKEAQNKNGATPLHIATEWGSTDAVQLLIQTGANKEAQNKNGATPLHHAAIGRHTEAVRILLEAGADRRAQDETGRTALSLATLNKHDAICRLLRGEAGGAATSNLS